MYLLWAVLDGLQASALAQLSFIPLALIAEQSIIHDCKPLAVS